MHLNQKIYHERPGTKQHIDPPCPKGSSVLKINRLDVMVPGACMPRIYYGDKVSLKHL